MSGPTVPPNEPNFVCPNCGHRMWAEFKGTVDFSVEVLCPGCRTSMNCLDLLGELEARWDAETREQLRDG